MTLIHTNDLHSHFDRWPHTAAVVKRELARAAEAGRPALYMDAGDHVDMSERTSYGTRARVNQRLLADLGCCAYTPGNNETMRLRLAEIDELGRESHFPWLGANLRPLHGDPLGGVKDGVIVEAGPVKVGIFGMTCMGPWAPGMGLEFVEFAPTMRRCAEELRQQGAHFVVCLSHMGIDHDLQYAGNGVDLIVGGHSHTALARHQWWSKTAIVQAGEFGEWVGVLDLEVDLSARRLTAVQGRLVPVELGSVAPDPGALRILAEETAAAEAALSGVVAVLPADLPHDPVGESHLGPLVAEALRRKAGAEVGLLPGGQALRGLPAGPVTRSQIMSAMPAMFIPALLEFTGAHLAALLEQSEDPACHGYQLFDSGMRPRGTPVGRISAAGLERRPNGELRVNGEPLDPERVYTVGAPSLLSFAESGYSAVVGVRLVKRYTPEFVREVFEEALRDGIGLMQ